MGRRFKSYREDQFYSHVITIRKAVMLNFFKWALLIIVIVLWLLVFSLGAWDYVWDHVESTVRETVQEMVKPEALKNTPMEK